MAQQYKIPSWRDLDVELSDSATNYLDYTIEGRDLNYQGRAYPNPSGKTVVRVSDIIRDTIDPQLPFSLSTGITVNSQAYNSCAVKVDNNLLHIVQMFLDNSYSKDLYYNNAHILSEPVTGVLDPRQRLLFNVAYFNSIQSVYVNGQEYPFDYSYGGNVQYNLDMPQMTSAVTVQIGSEQMTYSVCQTHADYVLYYVNSRGGFDSILLNHKNVKKTKNTPTMFKKYGNNYLPKHQLLKLNNIEEETVEFTTGWLKDNQVERIYNVYNTTCAYLQDLKNGDVIPVNVNSNQYEVKDMRSNGKKFSLFTIQLQYSVNKKII